MNEKPIERLNYYNGQRLEADDLKLEQEYHIRVRRWLNRSLYSAGIARGLEVKAEKEGLNVVVRPGLALDSDGREIILLEEERIAAIGKHNLVGNVDVGFYLTIQYREQKVAEEPGGYTPKNGKRKKAADCLALGGPSRVLAEPILGWSDILPHESSGKIVLARVLLDDKCKSIESLQTDVRRYVGASSASKVRQYALEGERHIDSNNPGRIYFHIRGRQPSAVTLYLRAEEFSTLYYTELGWHEHTKTLSGASETLGASAVDDHIHEAHEAGGDMETELDGLHTNHEVKAEISARQDGGAPGPSFWDIGLAILTGGASIPFSIVKTIVDALRGAKDYPPAGTEDANGNLVPEEPFFALRVVTRDRTPDGHGGTPISTPNVDLKKNVGLSVEGGEHFHKIKGKTGKPTETIPLHTHPLNTSLTIDKAGVDQTNTKYKSRSGITEKALTYVDDLQVSIGKVDETGKPLQAVNYTLNILTQLRNIQPTQSWDKLGNGEDNHSLVVNGTGPIKLDFLQGLDFDEGEYCIILHAPDKDSETGDPIPNGGRILYNLYVE